jgi:hypothetical protein
MPTTGRFYKIDVDTEIGHYSDCLFYQEVDIADLDDKQIDEMAAKETQARVDNWVAFVQEQSSKEPVPPSKDDLDQQALQLQDQLSTLMQQYAQCEETTSEDVQGLIDVVTQTVSDAAEQATTAVSMKPIRVKPNPIKPAPIEEPLSAEP